MKPGDVVKIYNYPSWEHLGIGIVLNHVEGSIASYNVYWSGDGKHRVFYEGYLRVIQ